MFNTKSATASVNRFAAILSARTNKKHSTWHTASKPAFYAAFYAVDQATWSSSR